MKIQTKRRGNLLSARKSIVEQTRLRQGFERKLYKQMVGYFSSTGRQASTDVLLKLWAQLRLAEKQAKTRNKTKYDFFKKHQPNNLQKTASELSNRVLGEIVARCTVCSTPANPPYKSLYYSNRSGYTKFLQ